MDTIEKNEKKIMVIGATGLVGSSLFAGINKKNVPFEGTYNKRPKDGLRRLDVISRYDLNKCFYEVRPTCVINTANLAGGVDFCEKNPDLAKEFHFDAVKNMVKMCNELDSKFIFISTDYIFDGEDGPYTEEDTPNPLNLYGRLKLDAEEYIRDNMENYLIIRTTNVYGWDLGTVTPNYMMSLYRALKERKEFNAPSFLWGNPTYVFDLANAIIELYEKSAKGVFHVVGSSFVNRFFWAGLASKLFDLDSTLIKEILSPNEKMIPRPLRSNLSAEKFIKNYNTVLHDVNEGLASFVKKIE